MKVRFIVNPAAGSRFGSAVERVTRAVREELASTVGRFEVVAPRSGQGAEVYSREARALGYDAVFACGGDGTINSVAGPLVGSATALGVVPLGSGNGLARSLGIPEDVREAVRLARTGVARPIDVGTVAGRYFFSTAGVGIDALLAERYNSGAVSGMMRGILPYVPIAVREALRYDPETVTMASGNAVERIAPLVLTVANTPRYGGGAVIAPSARPDDGFLDVALIPATGFFGAVSFGLRLMRGTVESAGGYRCFRTTSLDVYRREDSYVHADGEPFHWGGEVTFGILPRALRMLVAGADACAYAPASML